MVDHILGAFDLIIPKGSKAYELESLLTALSNVPLLFAIIIFEVFGVSFLMTLIIIGQSCMCGRCWQINDRRFNIATFQL